MIKLQGRNNKLILYCTMFSISIVRKTEFNDLCLYKKNIYVLNINKMKQTQT